MTQLEIFNWAYSNYKKEFENNRDDYLFKKGINSKKYPHNSIRMIEVKCEIEEDWILAIEKGLIYIAKAIKEDRQFIRNDGDVLPIEKIRRVSKDSITDLSKHSNYITKVPEEETENVVPEKLLMIKRENDYAIYENRVVYTTLLYLKDFVSSRLDKIKEATNKYDGGCKIRKQIDLGYRSIDFELNLAEVRKNDPIFVENNSHLDKIQRLDMILNDILLLLKTTLMVEVSKAPLVKRPVTKTNVLKMNTNFKEALAVFDYVCAYNKPGYTITEEEKVICPLNAEQENSFNDIIQLSSFLVYIYNNHLEEELKESFILEEKRRKKIKEDEILEKIKELLGKAKNSDKELGEYLYMLEEGYRILEERVEEAKRESQEIIARCEKTIEEYTERHQEMLNEINRKHAEDIAQIHAEHDQALQDAYDDYFKKLGEANEIHAAEISQKDEQITNLTTEVETLTTTLETKEKEFTEEKERLTEELNLANAELLAIRLKDPKNKVKAKDYITKERFDELESEKEALDKFFKKAWNETKKDIRKKHLMISNIGKNKKGGDNKDGKVS